MLWIHTVLIQGSRDQLAFDQSPELIAVFHALHRLLAPRHPPHALSSLTAMIPGSFELVDCRQQTVDSREPLSRCSANRPPRISISLPLKYPATRSQQPGGRHCCLPTVYCLLSTV